MNSQKLRDTNTLAPERSRMASGITGLKSAVITLPDAKTSSQAPSRSSAGTSCESHAKDSELAEDLLIILCVNEGEGKNTKDLRVTSKEERGTGLKTGVSQTRGLVDAPALTTIHIL